MMDKNLELALMQSIQRSDDDYIFIDPVCGFFGIQTRNQLDRLKKDMICQTDMQKISCQSVFGDNKLRHCIGKRGFIRWIQIINPEILRKNLRELFIHYQVAIFDYLYNGTQAKVSQLEDIRTYAVNINNALRVRDQVMEFITEQKNHRDLCLESSPDEWAKIKPSLTQEKQLPEGTVKLKAVGAALPNDKDELMRMKKNYQTNIVKDKNLLLYRSKYRQIDENPMPEGYRREIIKVRIHDCEIKIEEINQRLLELLR